MRVLASEQLVLFIYTPHLTGGGSVCVCVRLRDRGGWYFSHFHTVPSDSARSRAQVLFPLLRGVIELCAAAPAERDLRETPALLIHHTRDTAAKQWAETVTITTTGVAQLYLSKEQQLLPLGGESGGGSELCR